MYVEEWSIFPFSFRSFKVHMNNEQLEAFDLAQLSAVYCYIDDGCPPDGEQLSGTLIDWCLTARQRTNNFNIKNQLMRISINRIGTFWSVC